MKHYDKLKTAQLVVYILLTIGALYFIFTDEQVFRLIAVNSTAKVLFGILWFLMGISYFFLFCDFSSYSTLKKENSELDLAIFSDPVTGLANRNSCDAFIEKYLDQPLPKDIGCITLEIINLMEINQKHGHIAGNQAIKDFSAMLMTSASGLCFVGRNGGNKFLALFQDCSREKLDTFLLAVKERMDTHNTTTDKADIVYKYGVAFDEGEEVKTINELIALSNRRSIESYRTFAER